MEGIFLYKHISPLGQNRNNAPNRLSNNASGKNDLNKVVRPASITTGKIDTMPQNRFSTNTPENMFWKKVVRPASVTTGKNRNNAQKGSAIIQQEKRVLKKLSALQV